MSERVAGAELKAFMERVERIREEKSELNEMEKEVFAEAKGRGYDVKAMKTVLTLRKAKANGRMDDIAEHEAIVDMYAEAVGV